MVVAKIDCLYFCSLLLRCPSRPATRPACEAIPPLRSRCGRSLATRIHATRARWKASTRTIEVRARNHRRPPRYRCAPMATPAACSPQGTPRLKLVIFESLTTYDDTCRLRRKPADAARSCSPALENKPVFRAARTRPPRHRTTRSSRNIFGELASTATRPSILVGAVSDRDFAPFTQWNSIDVGLGRELSRTATPPTTTTTSPPPLLPETRRRPR